jgi:selenocysteine-specific elongation factor
VRHIILGTAGHVDHGKTALVKALTGIDTDRLKEEKERGISIELGFAKMAPSPELEIGIVDVPGHERFVRTMLAGVGGIDLALLVIAADEGVMPQTREHLDICQLLKIKKGVVALTKVDLVDEEWLMMVKAEVEDFLKGTFLEGAPIIPCSSLSGYGLADLTSAIANLASSVAEKPISGIFRLPIDRAFSIKGFGTVVTGTMLSGSIRVGEEVQVYPRIDRLISRVRRLQVHNRSVEEAYAGQRTAVNLPNIELAQVRRGDVLSLPGRLRSSLLLDARFLHLASSPRPLKARTRIRFHAGTSEILGRIIPLESEEIPPGQETFIQIRLEAPIALLPGDRFVIRSYSPAVTIGGGEILDAHPQRHRPRHQKTLEALRLRLQGDPWQRLEEILRGSGPRPFSASALSLASGMDKETVLRHLEDLVREGKAVALAEREELYVHGEIYRRIGEQILEQLSRFHQEEPLKDGMMQEDLRNRLSLSPEISVFQKVLGYLKERGEVVVEKGKTRLAGHRPQLGPEEERIKDELERIYREAGFQPSPLAEVLAQVSRDARRANDLVQLLLEEGTLVRIKGDLLYHRESYEKARGALLDLLRGKGGSVSVPEFKDRLGITRKWAIPLLEHFDEIKLTRRVGDERVLYGS